MAGITELKDLVSDNFEATQIVNSIEATMNTNTGTISDLEKRLSTATSGMNDAISSRDKVKGIIKDELGIEEFSQDSIRGKLSTYGNQEANEARDKQFNDFRGKSNATIEALEKKISDGNSAMDGMKMRLAISGTDIMGQTKGEHANAMLLDWISQDAIFDEQGNISYKGEGGETIYNANGNPMTLDDRINEIKSDESRDFVFQARFLNGGGAPTDRTVTGPAGSSDGGAYTRTTMNEQEKHSYIEKYGMSAYTKLPMV